ncbi:MAG: DUF3127 domain-containing protein [Bacteroidia bacterium]
MTYSTTGQVYHIGDKQTFPSGFTKIDLGITRNDCSSYPNINLEFSGEDVEKVAALQNGNLVKITFELQGKPYITKDGNTKIFILLRGRSVELVTAVVPTVARPEEGSN